MERSTRDEGGRTRADTTEQGGSSSVHIVGRVLDLKPRAVLQSPTITKQEDLSRSQRMTLGGSSTSQHTSMHSHAGEEEKVPLGHHPHALYCRWSGDCVVSFESAREAPGSPVGGEVSILPCSSCPIPKCRASPPAGAEVIPVDSMNDTTHE